MKDMKDKMEDIEYLENEYGRARLRYQIALLENRELRDLIELSEDIEITKKYLDKARGKRI
jgi:hypothetical protein